MSTLALPAFNPLQFAKRLKEAGLPDKQAEAEAEVLREAFDERDRAFAALENRVSTQKLLSEKDTEQLATKGDVFAVKEAVFGVKADVRNEITDLRGEMKLQRALLTAALGGIVAILVRSFF